MTWPLLRPVVNVVLVLGVVYTIKVLDIILGLTGGGPANATQTIATQAYHLSFQEFQFGQGAALGNVLIVISLVFALLYLRANRRAGWGDLAMKVLTTRRSGARGGTPLVGVLMLAVMLFPLYWMLNVSLQPSGSAVAHAVVPVS